MSDDEGLLSLGSVSEETEGLLRCIVVNYNKIIRCDEIQNYCSCGSWLSQVLGENDN